MKKQLHLESPCKVNLHLEVGKKRPDGFHSLTSIFHLTSLSDTILLEIEDDLREHEGFSLIDVVMIDGPDIPKEKNLVYRGAKLFMNSLETKIPLRIYIELTKKIPDGAGLGGGSSNAATILMGLNFILDYPYSDEELLEMAGQLGSDVPFFIYSGAAKVSGRGEVIESLPCLTGIPIVIVVPPVYVSTAMAFQLLDDKGACVSTLDEGYLKEYYEGGLDTWSFFNSFQKVIAEKYPVIDDLIADFKECGASFAQMSGSGSAVFGLFLSDKEAQEAMFSLKNKYSCVYKKKLIEKIESWV